MKLNGLEKRDTIAIAHLGGYNSLLIKGVERDSNGDDKLCVVEVGPAHQAIPHKLKVYVGTYAPFVLLRGRRVHLDEMLITV